MNRELAAEVGRLSDWGWSVKSQTESTAALENRRPFGWLLFALSILILPFFGGMLYVVFWFLTSREDLFLRVEDDKVVFAGDTWVVEAQAVQAEASKQLNREMRQRGFWPVVGPALVSLAVSILVWILVVWAILEFLRWVF